MLRERQLIEDECTVFCKSAVNSNSLIITFQKACKRLFWPVVSKILLQRRKLVKIRSLKRFGRARKINSIDRIYGPLKQNQIFIIFFRETNIFNLFFKIMYGETWVMNDRRLENGSHNSRHFHFGKLLVKTNASSFFYCTVNEFNANSIEL